MLNCRQVTRLVSKSMDARLPWHQRLAVRFHLLYCVWCRRYAAQLQFLRKATKDLVPDAREAPPHMLSREAKDRIRARLHEARKENPPPP
jgi:putative zinc finger protein